MADENRWSLEDAMGMAEKLSADLTSVEWEIWPRKNPTRWGGGGGNRVGGQVLIGLSFGGHL
jgi:hypothetical protein